MTNWADYNEDLRRRSDVTIWISEDVLSLWSAPRRTTRGGQPHYFDLAIQTCLTNVADRVHRLIADGAYDGGPAATTIRRAFGPDVELIIPLPKNAIPGDCTTRNAHIDMIARDGRMAWQQTTGYGQRSRGEAQIGHYKQIIGPQQRGRQIETQTTETCIAVKAHNGMARLWSAAYERGA